MAQRNLLRSLTFRLPSGQNLARAMQETPLAAADLRDLKEFGLDTRTPLWFYALREAEVQEGGKQLGPVAGRIVAEVFIGVLEGDPVSYLRQDPEWQPTLPQINGKIGDFKIIDLLNFASVVSAL